MTARRQPRSWYAWPGRTSEDERREATAGGIVQTVAAGTTGKGLDGQGPGRERAAWRSSSGKPRIARPNQSIPRPRFPSIPRAGEFSPVMVRLAQLQTEKFRRNVQRDQASSPGSTGSTWSTAHSASGQGHRQGLLRKPRRARRRKTEEEQSVSAFLKKGLAPSLAACLQGHAGPAVRRFSRGRGRVFETPVICGISHENWK